LDFIVYLWVFASVCLSVCHTITFESLDLGSSYLHMSNISTQYGSSSYMKVIGTRSRSHEQKTPMLSCHPYASVRARALRHRGAWRREIQRVISV